MDGNNPNLFVTHIHYTISKPLRFLYRTDYNFVQTSKAARVGNFKFLKCCGKALYLGKGKTAGSIPTNGVPSMIEFIFNRSIILVEHRTKLRIDQQISCQKFELYSER